MRFLVAWIDGLMRTARSTYRVDPVVFLVLYLLSAPGVYYARFRMIRAAAARRANKALFWSTVFLCAVVAPFLYVLVFGRNLPWWVYAVIVLVVGQSVFSLVRKLRGKAASRAEG